MGQKKYRFIIISRIGQSFSVISLGNYKYLITDSHVKYVGYANKINCLKYIMHEHTDGFNLILWHCGEIE